MKRHFVTWRELLADIEASGSHFFDAGNMRCFRSRRCGYPIPTDDNATLFVTSERFVASNGYPPGRRYTVRKWTESADGMHVGVDTVGEFQAYTSREQAIRAALAEATRIHLAAQASGGGS